MEKDFSFGIIPLRIIDSAWQLLLVEHHGNWWSFPKGHSEIGEQPKETAARELKEEVGLDIVHFLDVDPLVESYQYTRDGKIIDKTVTYFLATVEGELHLLKEELRSAKWTSLNQAESVATFLEGKEICRQVNRILKGKKL